MIVRSHLTRIACAMGIALSATLNRGATAQPQPFFVGTTIQLTTNEFSQTNPAVSGSVVIWTDQRNLNDDIYFCNVTNCAGTEQQVTFATNAQRLSDVSGSLIAYTDISGSSRVVRVFDIATSTTTTIQDPSADQNPRLDGRIVAFERGPSSNPDVNAVDLATGIETAVAGTSALELNPVVGGGRVVYERHATGASPGDIVLYDLATGQLTEVEAGPGDARRPDIDGDIVVWDVLSDLGDADIVVHNLSTGITTQVQHPGNQRSPHISGDVVAFDDDSAGNPNIGLYHIPTGTLEIVTTAGSAEFLNDISGNRVVYTSNAAVPSTLDIWMFEFELPDTNQAPSIIVIANPLILEGNTTGGFNRASLTPAAAAITTSDPDGDLVTLTHDAPSLLPLGNTLVTWTASDGEETATATQTVTVRDTTGPSLTVPADITQVATSQHGKVVTYAASANDIVDPAPSLGCAPASGSLFPLGTTTVSCTATDASGNGRTTGFKVTLTIGNVNWALDLEGDHIVTGHVNGNVRVRNGTLTVHGTVNGNILQEGTGGVVINGYVNGNITEKDAGDVTIGTNGSVGGNVEEEGAGSVLGSGRIFGNASEKQAGGVAATLRVSGSVSSTN